MSASDTLRRAHDLYRQKNEKGSDFAFEHCWVLLRDHPKWAEGWTHVKIMTPKRKAPCSEEDPDCIDLNEMERGVRVDSEEGAGSAEGRSVAAKAERIFKGRPGGAKLAKEDRRQGKIREGLLFAHAEPTKSMAAAHMRKAALLEDQNLLMLMSMPDADLDAKEYMRLRRQMDLRKLCKLVAEEENRDAEAATAIVVVVGVSSLGAWSPNAEGVGLQSLRDGDGLHLELGGDAEDQVGVGQEHVGTHNGGGVNLHGAGSLHFHYAKYMFF